MDIYKQQSREILSSIKQVLLDYWDPIGIKTEPGAQDEYDGYIGSIYRLLVNHATVEQIVQHLNTIQTQSMGLSSNTNSLKIVADKLLQINVHIETGGGGLTSRSS